MNDNLIMVTHDFWYSYLLLGMKRLPDMSTINVPKSYIFYKGFEKQRNTQTKEVESLSGNHVFVLPTDNFLKMSLACMCFTVHVKVGTHDGTSPCD